MSTCVTHRLSMYSELPVARGKSVTCFPASFLDVYSHEDAEVSTDASFPLYDRGV